ncbi:unnamed protein product, partial [Didymodactylos carnosus]
HFFIEQMKLELLKREDLQQQLNQLQNQSDEHKCLLTENQCLREQVEKHCQIEQNYAKSLTDIQYDLQQTATELLQCRTGKDRLSTENIASQTKIESLKEELHQVLADLNKTKHSLQQKSAELETSEMNNKQLADKYEAAIIRNTYDPRFMNKIQNLVDMQKQEQQHKDGKQLQMMFDMFVKKKKNNQETDDDDNADAVSATSSDNSMKRKQPKRRAKTITTTKKRRK